MKGAEPFAGVVTADNNVSFHPVTVAESDGKTIQVGSGLRAGERVVLNPGESISEEEQVRPINATRTSKQCLPTFSDPKSVRPSDSEIE